MQYVAKPTRSVHGRRNEPAARRRQSRRRRCGQLSKRSRQLQQSRCLRIGRRPAQLRFVRQRLHATAACRGQGACLLRRSVHVPMFDRSRRLHRRWQWMRGGSIAVHRLRRLRRCLPGRGTAVRERGRCLQLRCQLSRQRSHALRHDVRRYEDGRESLRRVRDGVHYACGARSPDLCDECVQLRVRRWLCGVQRRLRRGTRRGRWRMPRPVGGCWFGCNVG